MFYFKMNDADQVVAVAEKITNGEHAQWISRHKIADMLHANRIAREASQLDGRLFTAVDSGPNVWPRFDVVQAPKVGDKVSYGFNGDYYPDGEIVHVTAGTLRQVKTSTGNTYYRRKQTGSWVQKGGTWSMVQGHIDERNPSF